MNELFPMSSAELGEEDIEAVLEVLHSGRLALGPKAAEFEHLMTSYIGVKHAVAVSSGTAALHVLVRALGIQPGDEVLVPSFTFAASVNVILYERAVPVFVDIDPDTYNLDVDELERKVTRRTKAIMAVDVFGHPCRWDLISDFAARHSLRVIDDSCEAIGAEFEGRKLGQFGDAAAFAFYPNKQMTTGEGGMIVTNHDEIAQVTRSMCNQGRSSHGAWLDHERLGYNYRIDEMSAALGVSQLRRLDQFLAKRERVAKMYSQRLSAYSWVQLPNVRPYVRKSWFVYVVTLVQGIDLEGIMQSMAECGVPTRRYFYPIHLQPYIRDYLHGGVNSLAVTEDIASRTLALPFHNNLSEDEIDQIVGALVRAVTMASKTPRAVARLRPLAPVPGEGPLPFFVPDVGEAEITAVSETLKSGWLTAGPRARQFENEFAERVGCKHALAVNSATSALHLALEAVGVTQGDEVLVPTMTFTATAEVVVHLKATPVLVEVHPDTLTIDPDAIESKITPRTKAIVPVHFGGHPCDMDRVLAIARKHNLKVIEDAAHALPAVHKGKMVGTIGDVTCFSFYVTKSMTTGDGGMVTTDDPALAEHMRIMSLHGVSRDAWHRQTFPNSWQYDVLFPGYKYNMTDILAAMGVEQLRRMDGFWRVRQRYAEIYDRLLSEIPGVRVPRVDKDMQHAWHLYIIQLELEQFTISRNEFMERLLLADIGTSVHYKPLHMHPYYRDAWGFQPDDFPVARDAFDRIVSLPIYSRMREDQLYQVVATIRRTLAACRR